VLFTEPVFALFFAVALFVHWFALSTNTSRKVFLVAASYVFYAWWEWHFVALLVGMTVANFGLGIAVERGKRWALPLGVFANLGLLGVFKYFNFFTESFSDLMDSIGLPANQVTLTLTLPVAISFITFEAVSYLIDIRRGELPAERSLLDLSLFFAFFPRLVAGPIVRPSRFLPQLKQIQDRRDIDWRSSIGLFIVGYVKKAIVANSVASEVDKAFADPSSLSSAAVFVAVLLYAVQIYGDFSGYSDMAIASGRMLGYDLDRNFDAPYLSPSLEVFWRRWHMTLSSWLRDYLYISLGGNRKGVTKTYRNLFLTMVLGGLWHGSSWNFVVWGALHGGGLAVNRWWTRRPNHRQASDVGRIGTMLLTFWFVCLCWIFFRAPDFTTAWEVTQRFVLPVGGPSEGLVWYALVVAGIAAMVHVWAYANREALTRWWSELSPVSMAATTGLAIPVILSVVPPVTAPFIYFQF
jgi:alginate O-acetyltransferase complex protein AlgI